MGALSQTLNQTEQTVLQVGDLDSAAGTKLDSVVSEAQKLEGTVRELLDQVEFMKNSDIRGEAAPCGRSHICRHCFLAPKGHVGF